MVAAPAVPEQAGPPQAAVRPKAISPAVPLLIGSLVLACGVATQVLAAALHYSPALGHPLVALSAGQAFAAKVAAVLVIAAAGGVATWRQSWQPFGPGLAAGIVLAVVSPGPIYDPTQGIGWGLRLAQQPAFRGLAERAALSGAAAGGAAFVTAYLLLPKASERAPSGAFGTAKFGDPSEFKGVSGPIIGRHGGELVRYPGNGHLITIAPTGSGKGIGSVLPNVLMHPGSLVVTDPKGENAAVAKRHREDMGQQVEWLDPWAVVAKLDKKMFGTAQFNPLDFIDPASLDANDDAWLIAEQLVPPTYHGSEEGHWLDQARAFLAGLILHNATKFKPGAKERCLPYVRECVCRPDSEFNALLAEMAANEACAGSVSRVATLFKRIMDRSEKEFGSIMSTVARHTWFLDSPRIRGVMSKSTFNMESLKTGKLTVFISVPRTRLDTYAAWQRVVLACAIAATNRVSGRPEHNVQLIIDEAGNMGTLPQLPRTVTLSRGDGLTVWAIFQDLSQPKALYNTRWATFLSNADVLQTFGTNDHETTTFLSAMAGDETIVVETANASASRNRGGRGGSGSSSGTAVTAAERGRKLMFANEIRTSDDVLCFLKGRDPLRLERVSYLRDPEFVGLFDDNPTYNAVPVPGGGA